MKLKATLAALAISLSPGLALAEGGCHGIKAESVSAMSCLPGTSWDDEKGTCVATPSS